MNNKTSMMDDVCVIAEGTYPYVVGGVAQWIHQLFGAHPELRFHLVSIMPPGAYQAHYAVPQNVVRQTLIRLPWLSRRVSHRAPKENLAAAFQAPLTAMQRGAGLPPIRHIIELLRSSGGGAADLLLNSPAGWRLLEHVYRQTCAEVPFLAYFWGWRTLLAGLFTILTTELPRARVYHPICTGYAGLLATRAHLETGRPVVLTEHGIYTNERRIEIAMADWIQESSSDGLSIKHKAASIRDLWVDWFAGYSRACYECSTEIITLYEGNQAIQRMDGAPPDRLRIIPNGIDCGQPATPGPRKRATGRPTIALIGRVVPIKDVKTFLRACASLRNRIPGLQALVLGPTEEDPEYYRQCLELTDYLKLNGTVSFRGRVNLSEYFSEIDVVVLTSISEAQPLVILEAGAEGIPAVATDAGACAEMIHGRSDEQPRLGPAGVVTPLANPSATAEAVFRLLTDGDFHGRCSRAITERVRRYYSKQELDRAYHELYERLRRAPSAQPAIGREPVRVA